MGKTGVHLEKASKQSSKKLWIIILLITVVIATAVMLIVVLSGGENKTTNDQVDDSVIDDVQAVPDNEPEITDDVTPEPVPEPEIEPVVTPEPETPEFVNPLTGMEVESDISDKRPYAVMINNIKKALPQWGVNSADIIYEVPVEGGITRMLAIYQDISVVDVIGSIRSSRPYFIDILQGYDAIYLHAGGSNDAYSSIKKNDIDNIDGVHGSGVNDVFYRDSWRKSNLGFEHSLMAKTEEIINYAAKKEMRLEHEEGYTESMVFADEVNLEGETAEVVDIYLTSSKNTEFVYDSQNRVYALSQYGKEYVDGRDDTQVTVKNVIVIYASTKTIDNAGRLKITLTGNGNGYYACGGKYVPITWTKESAKDNFSFALTDGTPVTFERGITYICVASEKHGSATFG